MIAMSIRVVVYLHASIDQSFMNWTSKGIDALNFKWNLSELVKGYTHRNW